MKEKIQKIDQIYAAFKLNAEAQAEKGNKAAGVRARKAALELSKELKEFRKLSVAGQYRVGPPDLAGLMSREGGSGTRPGPPSVISRSSSSVSCSRGSAPGPSSSRCRSPGSG